ncbi:kinase-like domain-containing protein [Chaetomium fimeti]|uniref:Kinase-like domain-containing protein n=1 Tax=Chaetomium fimeti TaxID=1854472 RepID=A0AAE0LNR7_9PEZI|nr:kinase-like domain-containing protein [Chaetomium fimeti]
MQPITAEQPGHKLTPLPKPLPKPLPTWIKLRIALIKPLHRGKVIVLPFGRILKMNAPANEMASMEFVRANTTIPVPKILDIYELQPDGSAHILMTRVQGTLFSHALHTMNPVQVQSVVSDLSGYLAQMHRLTQPTQAPTSQGPTIGGTTQGPGYDHSLGSYVWGPFPTVADFHTYVRFGEPLEDWVHEPAVMEVHAKPEAYRVRYSHADLAPHNIIVDPKAGKITGIIDWEFGGWYPEYWEYIKIHYAPRRQWAEYYAAIDKEEGIQKYPKEQAAEEVIWLRAGPFGYDR